MSQGPVQPFMESDHDRLDGQLKAFQEAKHRDPPAAGGLFRRFESGLRRHIRWEEETLFPRFEERTGMEASGPTAVMRQEHRDIEATLDRMRTLVDREDAATDALERRLLEVLGPHNEKEEAVLYPWIDGALPAADRNRMVLGFQAEARMEP